MKKSMNVLEYMRSLTPIDTHDFSQSILSEWTQHWLTHYCNNIKESTLSSYDTAVKLHINRVLGDVRLTELTSEDVQLFVNSLSMGVGIDELLSPKSIRNIHGVLHKCLSVAVTAKHIHDNPADSTILPRVIKPDIQPLTPAQLQRFLKAIKGHNKELLFTVAVFTGLRQAELIALTWDCIDFDSGSIYVYRQLVKEKGKGGTYKFTSLKNNKTRRLYPASFIIHQLYAAKCSRRSNSEYVFTNSKGTHYTHYAVYNSFIKVARKIGLEHTRFHDLRHTYAVLSLQAGDDVKTLQENMGHHSAAFTLDVYGHCTDEMKRASSCKMERYVSQQFQTVLNTE
ncbi:MAG: site-specific integrase [Ruminococcus sp.]|nr:site-specific integrase [Oscillospiraceae bacterium]MBQ6945854.1 site-specific integrase [Ruminococcus sp.]